MAEGPQDVAAVCDELDAAAANRVRDRQGAAVHLSSLVRAAKGARRRGEEISPARVLRTLAPFTVVRDSNLRTACYRALRHLVSDAQWSRAFGDSRLILPLCRSLDRDRRYLLERMQALKLARQVVSICPQFAPRGLVRCIVSLAGCPGDQLRRVCVETVREWARSGDALRTVAQCGGLVTLADALLDTECRDMSPSILLTLVHVSGSPHLERWSDSRSWVARVISALTTPMGEPVSATFSESDRRRWAVARQIIVSLTRSWGGLSVIGGGREGLAALVSVLAQEEGKAIQPKLCVLRTILECLSIPPWSQAHALSQTRAIALASLGDNIRAAASDTRGLRGLTGASSQTQDAPGDDGSMTSASTEEVGETSTFAKVTRLLAAGVPTEDESFEDVAEFHPGYWLRSCRGSDWGRLAKPEEEVEAKDAASRVGAARSRLAAQQSAVGAGAVPRGEVARAVQEAAKAAVEAVGAVEMKEEGVDGKEREEEFWWDALGFGAEADGRVLVDSWRTAVLMVFLEARLIPTLCRLALSDDSTLALAAGSLLRGVLSLTVKLLPPAEAARVLSLPSLRALALLARTGEPRADNPDEAGHLRARAAYDDDGPVDESGVVGQKPREQIEAQWGPGSRSDSARARRTRFIGATAHVQADAVGLWRCRSSRRRRRRALALLTWAVPPALRPRDDADTLRTGSIDGGGRRVLVLPMSTVPSDHPFSGVSLRPTWFRRRRPASLVHEARVGAIAPHRRTALAWTSLGVFRSDGAPGPAGAGVGAGGHFVDGLFETGSAYGAGLATLDESSESKQESKPGRTFQNSGRRLQQSSSKWRDVVFGTAGAPFRGRLASRAAAMSIPFDSGSLGLGTVTTVRRRTALLLGGRAADLVHALDAWVSQIAGGLDSDAVTSIGSVTMDAASFAPEDVLLSYLSAVSASAIVARRCLLADVPSAAPLGPQGLPLPLSRVRPALALPPAAVKGMPGVDPDVWSDRWEEDDAILLGPLRTAAPCPDPADAARLLRVASLVSGGIDDPTSPTSAHGIPAAAQLLLGLHRFLSGPSDAAVDRIVSQAPGPLKHPTSALLPLGARENVQPCFEDDAAGVQGGIWDDRLVVDTDSPASSEVSTSEDDDNNNHLNANNLHIHHPDGITPTGRLGKSAAQRASTLEEEEDEDEDKDDRRRQSRLSIELSQTSEGRPAHDEDDNILHMHLNSAIGVDEQIESDSEEEEIDFGDFGTKPDDAQSTAKPDDVTSNNSAADLRIQAVEQTLRANDENTTSDSPGLTGLSRVLPRTASSAEVILDDDDAGTGVTSPLHSRGRLSGGGGGGGGGGGARRRSLLRRKWDTADLEQWVLKDVSRLAAGTAARALEQVGSELTETESREAIRTELRRWRSSLRQWERAGSRARVAWSARVRNGVAEEGYFGGAPTAALRIVLRSLDEELSNQLHAPDSVDLAALSAALASATTPLNETGEVFVPPSIRNWTSLYAAGGLGNDLPPPPAGRDGRAEQRARNAQLTDVGPSRYLRKASLLFHPPLFRGVVAGFPVGSELSVPGASAATAARRAVQRTNQTMSRPAVLAEADETVSRAEAAAAAAYGAAAVAAIQFSVGLAFPGLRVPPPRLLDATALAETEAVAATVSTAEQRGRLDSGGVGGGTSSRATFAANPLAVGMSSEPLEDVVAHAMSPEEAAKPGRRARCAAGADEKMASIAERATKADLSVAVWEASDPTRVWPVVGASGGRDGVLTIFAGGTEETLFRTVERESGVWTGTAATVAWMHAQNNHGGADAFAGAHLALVRAKGAASLARVHSEAVAAVRQRLSLVWEDPLVASLAAHAPHASVSAIPQKLEASGSSPDEKPPTRPRRTSSVSGPRLRQRGRAESSVHHSGSGSTGLDSTFPGSLESSHLTNTNHSTPAPLTRLDPSHVNPSMMDEVAPSLPPSVPHLSLPRRKPARLDASVPPSVKEAAPMTPSAGTPVALPPVTGAAAGSPPVTGAAAGSPPVDGRSEVSWRPSDAYTSAEGGRSDNGRAFRAALNRHVGASRLVFQLPSTCVDSSRLLLAAFPAAVGAGGVVGADGSPLGVGYLVWDGGDVSTPLDSAVTSVAFPGLSALGVTAGAFGYGLRIGGGAEPLARAGFVPEVDGAPVPWGLLASTGGNASDVALRRWLGAGGPGPWAAAGALPSQWSLPPAAIPLVPPGMSDPPALATRGGLPAVDRGPASAGTRAASNAAAGLSAPSLGAMPWSLSRTTARHAKMASLVRESLRSIGEGDYFMSNEDEAKQPRRPRPDVSTRGGTAHNGDAPAAEAKKADDAAVARALYLVRMSKVEEGTDWRVWDWGLVAEILDVHATSAAVLAALMDGVFLWRLGRAFLVGCAGLGLPSEGLPGLVGPDEGGVPSAARAVQGTPPQAPDAGGKGLARLPWTPAAVRFVRCARQWILLLVHSERGRKALLSTEAPVRGECRPGDVIREIILSLLREAGAPAATPPVETIASRPRLRSLFSAAARRPTAGEEAKAAAAAAAAAGAANPWARWRFERQLGREFLRLLGALCSSAHGRIVLDGIAEEDFGRNVRAEDVPSIWTTTRDWWAEWRPLLHRSSDVSPPDAVLPGGVAVPSGDDGDESNGSNAPKPDATPKPSKRPSATGSTTLPRTASMAAPSPTPTSHPDAPDPPLPWTIAGLGPIGLDGRKTYLARAILNALSYSRCDAARAVLNLWISQGPVALRSAAVVLLRTRLRAGEPEWVRWGLPRLLERLGDPDHTVALQALSVLTEAAHVANVYRRAIAAARPRLGRFTIADAAPLAMALAAGWPGLDGGEGLAVLAERRSLAPILRAWELAAQLRYVLALDQRAMDALTLPGLGIDGLAPLAANLPYFADLEYPPHALLTSTYESGESPDQYSEKHSTEASTAEKSTTEKSTTEKSTTEKSTSEKPTSASDSIKKSVSGGRKSSSAGDKRASSSARPFSSGRSEPRPQPIPVWLPSGSRGSSAWGEEWSLEALTALPWRVEVEVEWASGLPDEKSEGGAELTRAAVECDTAVDLESYRPEAGCDVTASRNEGDQARSAAEGAVLVTAQCLGARGGVEAAALPPTARVRAALFLGNAPVDFVTGSVPFGCDQPDLLASGAEAANLLQGVLAEAEESAGGGPSFEGGALKGAKKPTESGVADARRRASEAPLPVATSTGSGGPSPSAGSGSSSSRGEWDSRRPTPVPDAAAERLSGASTLASLARSAAASTAPARFRSAVEWSKDVGVVRSARGVREAAAQASGETSEDVEDVGVRLLACASGSKSKSDETDPVAVALGLSDSVHRETEESGLSSAADALGVGGAAASARTAREAGRVGWGAVYTVDESGATLRQPGEVMHAARKEARRRVRWAEVSVAGVVPVTADRSDGGDAPRFVRVAASIRPACRFVFTTSRLAPGAVLLAGVEFCIRPLPERRTHAPLPAHLAGRLALHPPGRRLLLRSGMLREAAAAAMNPRCSTLRRRAAVWTLGQCGSVPAGAALLRDHVCPDWLLRLDFLARRADSPALRATAWQAISIAAKPVSVQIGLDHLGWSVALDDRSTHERPGSHWLVRSGLGSVPVHQAPPPTNHVHPMSHNSATASSAQFSGAAPPELLPASVASDTAGRAGGRAALAPPRLRPPSQTPLPPSIQTILAGGRETDPNVSQRVRNLDGVGPTLPIPPLRDASIHAPVDPATAPTSSKHESHPTSSHHHNNNNNNDSNDEKNASDQRLGPTVVQFVRTAIKSSNPDDIVDGYDIRDGFTHRPLPPLKPEWEPILQAVASLSVRFTFRDAQVIIQKAHAANPGLFTEPGLYWHVHALLAEYNFAVGIRRWLHSFFDNVRFDEDEWVPVIESANNAN